MLARTSSATVFFVRVGGSDDADGLSPVTAFASIRHAADALRNPGDQVIVGSGTFNDGDILPARSGFAGHPVVFLADTNGTATGDPPGAVVIAPAAPRTTGFLLAGRHNVVIEGFTVVGAIDAGVQVRTDSAGVVSSDIIIRNSVVRGSVKRGLDIQAGGFVAVESCLAAGSGSTGISVVGVGANGLTVAISSNQALQNGGLGIFVAGAIDGTIAGNQLEGNGGTGILVRSSANLSIVGNSVSGGQDGISAGVGSISGDAVTSVRLTENRVQASMKAGINVVAVDSVTVEQNTVANSRTSGVSIVGDGTTKVAVCSNDIRSSGADGILVRGAARLAVLHNAVQANAENGVRVQQSSHVTITDNTIANNQSAGVDAVATGAVALRRNSVVDNGAVGASLVAATNATILIDLSNNTLQQNAGGGIFVAGAAGGSMAENKVTDHPGGDGIVVRDSTRLSIVHNSVARSGGSGLAVSVGAEQSGGSDFSLLSNHIVTSGKAGINVFARGAVRARSNLVLHSGSTGLSIQCSADAVSPAISNNTIGMSGSHGIFLLGSHGGVLQNNVVFSNGETGITLRTAPDVSIVNNLVYGNAHDGLAVGTNDLAAPRPKILQNTAYANGGWGLRIGTNQAPSPGAIVLGNIFHLNQGDNVGMGAGIAVARSSTCGYVAGFNINDDGYGEGTPHNDYDIVADPLFLNPPGRDQQLGGDGYADDDFRLQQGRGGQTVQSPAVDAGGTPIADIGVAGTTAHGDVSDVGVIDIGYHYSAAASQQINVPTPFMPIFVRETGKKASDGLAPERALASIQDAARRAAAGGIVIVGPGTYFEGDIHPNQNRGPIAFFADATGVHTGDLPGEVLVDATGHETGFTLLNSCNASVRGFSIKGAANAGIQVRDGSDDASIGDNVVFSNQRRGIEARGAEAPHIDNNLVYANGTGGIHVEQGNNGDITNNTIYANGDVGILVGGSGAIGSALGTNVLRNIVAGNGKGVKVEPNSFGGYLTGFNVVADGFAGNSPRADSDFVPDKGVQLFVDPQGPDRILGGVEFLDDDFRLVRSSANPALGVDYGEPNTLVAGSTRSDGLPNLGAADAGYHYPFLHSHPVVDSTPPVFFVRASGNDRNNGLSPTRAFGSIARATAAVSGRGLIVIGPGMYREQRLLIGIAGRRSGVVAVLGDEGGQLTGDVAGKVVVNAEGHAAPTVAGPALIDGLTLTGARGPGLRVLRSARGVTLRNSTLCGNSGDGLVSAGEAVSVLNNLMCGNGGAGMSVRLRGAREATQLVNNTVAGNVRRGILVRETGAVGSRALVFNNVVSGNGGAGITTNAVRHIPPATGNNLNTDGYGATTHPGVDDLRLAPQFVGGPPTERIGCEHAEGFRVPSSSPLIDRGTRTAVELGLGTRSVTVGHDSDTGPADLGYHYRQ